MREMLPIKSQSDVRLVDGFYCSRCQWERRFAEPRSIVADGWSATAKTAFEAHNCNNWARRQVQHFRLEHPAQETVLCDDFACAKVADYVEVDEHGHELCLCASHTSSGKYAAVLPARKPKPEVPYRSRAAA
jgi:hypothetical protein